MKRGDLLSSDLFFLLNKGDVRNDIYVTLVQGDFDKGNKVLILLKSPLNSSLIGSVIFPLVTFSSALSILDM